jgi:hypothetical protein
MKSIKIKKIHTKLKSKISPKSKSKCQKTNFGSKQRDVVRDLMPRGGGFTEGEGWTGERGLWIGERWIFL